MSVQYSLIRIVTFQPMCLGHESAGYVHSGKPRFRNQNDFLRKLIFHPFVLLVLPLSAYRSNMNVFDTIVGEGVTNVKKGDAVALEPGATCMRCEFCKGGKYNVRPAFSFTLRSLLFDQLLPTRF
jgi:hypothetical protein